jgi:hypothetical protein
MSIGFAGIVIGRRRVRFVEKHLWEAEREVEKIRKPWEGDLFRHLRRVLPG